MTGACSAASVYRGAFLSQYSDGSVANELFASHLPPQIRVYFIREGFFRVHLVINKPIDGSSTRTWTRTRTGTGTQQYLTKDSHCHHNDVLIHGMKTSGTQLWKPYVMRHYLLRPSASRDRRNESGAPGASLVDVTAAVNASLKEVAEEKFSPSGGPFERWLISSLCRPRDKRDDQALDVNQNVGGDGFILSTCPRLTLEEELEIVMAKCFWRSPLCRATRWNITIGGRVVNRTRVVESTVGSGAFVGGSHVGANNVCLRGVGCTLERSNLQKWFMCVQSRGGALCDPNMSERTHNQYSHRTSYPVDWLKDVPPLREPRGAGRNRSRQNPRRGE